MAFEDGKYFAGAFQVPASTGDLSVTGLGFVTGCQGVMFFGSNQDGDDTVIAGADVGAFMGLMAQPDGSGGILAQANSVLLNGPNQQSRGQVPIFMLLDFATVDYAADPVSLDADGFTVDFVTLPAAGDRWVHYLAWGDWDNTECTRPPLSGGETLTLGWSVGAMLMAGCLSSEAGPVPAAVDGDMNRPDLASYTFGWWGGATYPLNDQLWNAGYLSLCGPGPGGSRHTRLMNSPPTTAVNFGFSFNGPFLEEALHHAHPTGAGYLDLYDDSFGLWNSDLFAFWNGDGDCGTGTPGDTFEDLVTQTLASIDTADAIVFFGTQGTEGFPGSEFNGIGLAFGVVTPGYQGCVAVSSDGHLFQSKTKSWCSNVGLVGSGPGTGANAGTTDLVPGSATFVWETDDDDVEAQSLAWVAFGHGGGFLPQMARIPVRPFQPGGASRLALSGDTSSLGPGESRDFLVRVLDSNGNLIAIGSSSSAQIILWQPPAPIPGTGSVTGTGTYTLAGGQVTVTVVGSASGVVTLQASGNVNAVISNPVTVGGTPGGPGTLCVIPNSVSGASGTFAASLNPAYIRQDNLSAGLVSWAATNSIGVLGLGGPMTTGLVSTYPTIDFWEYDNEPYFRGVSIGPYATAMRNFGATFKASYPTKTLIFPCYVQGDGGDYNGPQGFRPWVDYVFDFAPDIGNFYDGVAFHPYSSPRDAAPDFTLTDLVHNQLLARGFNKPVYVTEVGWSVGAGGDQVTEAQQASYIADFVTAARTRSWIEQIYVYCTLSGDGSFEGSFGLLDPGGSERTAATTFRGLV